MSYGKGIMESVAAAGAPITSYGKGIAAWLRSLTPNRVTVYLTVLANLTGAVYSVAATLNPAQVGGVVAALAGINAVAVMFLRGWQRFEQANYDAQALTYQINARAEQVAQASAPRSASSKLNLPR